MYTFTMRCALALMMVGVGVWLPSCAMPPHPPDPQFVDREPNLELMNAPLVRVETLWVNGQHVPPSALEASVMAMQPYLRGQVEYVHHGEIAVEVDEEGRFAGLVEWPRGQEPASRVPVIRIMTTPRKALTGFVTGSCGAVRTEADKDSAYALVHEIRLYGDVIAARSGVLVDEEKLWEWTLTHELGHVLGVPARASHTWTGAYPGRHCTHPECVMYSAIDWRVVLTGLTMGWPLDYCEQCKGDLSAESRDE